MFSDVTSANPFCDNIVWLAENGITTGTANPPGLPLFLPGSPVSRQAMAAFLHRSANPGVPPQACSSQRFADVPMNHAFCPQITWLAEQGISTGTANPPGLPLFLPGSPVSRQAMAAFLYRAAHPGSTPPGCGQPSFADVPVGNQFCPHIAWLANSGISTGTANPPGLPQFLPTSPVSRQAMAAFLHRSSVPGGLVSGWGRVGVGEANFEWVPDRLDSVGRVRDIIVSNDSLEENGFSSVYAIRYDNRVVVWGVNMAGQLGLGHAEYHVETPTVIPGLTDVVAIRATDVQAFALRADGSVWTWGGWTGVGPSPIRISGLTDITDITDSGSALRADGTVWVLTGPTSASQVSGLSDVVAISADGMYSNSNTYAVRSDGSVWTWGDNSQGQLGDGTTTPRTTPAPVSGLTGVRSVSTADTSVFALRGDGSVWAWGRNDYGQLGVGSSSPFVTVATPLPGLAGVVSLAAGPFFSVAVESDGTVSAWGVNTSGQLGDGTRQNRQSPVSVVGVAGVAQVVLGGRLWGNTYARLDDGTVWGWGNGDILGLGEDDTQDRLLPTQIPNLRATSISAGWASAYAIG